MAPPRYRGAAIAPCASIIVPTRARPAYLAAALRSIVPQAERAGAEVLVVDDGAHAVTRAVAGRCGARYLALGEPRGLNSARNAGVAASEGELVVFVDDDVVAPRGWLDALLDGAARWPEDEVLGGPIRAVLAGGAPRSCGREGVPVTALDLGSEDREAEFAWGANMAIRRRALERLGSFDEALDGVGCGDEEDWQRRYRAAGGRVRYVAGAGLEHRRTAEDSTLGALARAAYARGRAARRYDAFRGAPPPAGREALLVGACLGHAARRRCATGLLAAAHAAGRLREGVATGAGAPRPAVAAPASGEPDFLSGRSGALGRRATLRAELGDRALDARAWLRREGPRLDRAATAAARRRVLVLGVDRPDGPGLLAAAEAELVRSRHAVELAIAPEPAGRGKFENLNALLEPRDLAGVDWVLAIDDDVVLPPRFLDRFLYLAERFGLDLAQPAHRLRSQTAWRATRRHAGSLVRETAFVEIGPVTALAARTFDALLPFPPLRMGWGLDAHWAALARERGWRLGVVDATPVRHAARPTASAYDRGAAVAEAQAFLSGRPYLPRAAADRTLAVHRGW